MNYFNSYDSRNADFITLPELPLQTKLRYIKMTNTIQKYAIYAAIAFVAYKFIK